MSLTLDEILNSITTLITVLGAFIIAYFTLKGNKELQENTIKEKSICTIQDIL